MPFDLPDAVNSRRSIISALVQQADDAFAASDRATCIEIIEQIYSMLDVTSAGRLVKSTTSLPELRREGRQRCG